MKENESFPPLTVWWIINRCDMIPIELAFDGASDRESYHEEGN